MAITVISAFDGISVAKLALKNLGIDTTRYYAFEIDKYAIEVSRSHFSDITRMGDIRNFKENPQTPRRCDLLIGGSPCQQLSIVSPNQIGLKGKDSKLFYDFVALLKYTNPRYFIFENVASMKKCDRDEISKELGVAPIKIDSSLLTAQRRFRYYWTNIENVEQPEDKGIKLSDILEKEEDIDESYFYTKEDLDIENMSRIIRSKKIDMNRGPGFSSYEHSDKSRVVMSEFYCGLPFNFLKLKNKKARKFTPLECERLQGLPDNYTKKLEYNRGMRYKVIGDAFTLPVIEHIIKYAKEL